MSKIVITGSAIVLKSDLTLETLKKLAKYKPSALESRDEKDRLIFKVGIAGEGEGSISDKAVYFAPQTHDGEGLATVTLGIPASVKDAKDYTADLMGSVFPKLRELEVAMVGASDEVDAAKAEMLENITVQ